MSEISTLTIKIPLELKEKIKAAALEKQFSLSTEVCERLAQSFEADIKGSISSSKNAKLHHDEIDNQGVEEISEQPLSQKELKKTASTAERQCENRSKEKINCQSASSQQLTTGWTRSPDLISKEHPY